MTHGSRSILRMPLSQRAQHWVLIGTFIYFFADLWFGEYGATYLVVLGLMTLFMALFARGGVWGLICKVVDAPWFPTRRILLEDPQ